MPSRAAPLRVLSDEREFTTRRLFRQVNWASYPARAKAQCVQPGEYLPSYIEWKTCIEMPRDVTAIRKDQPDPSGAKPSSSRPNSTPKRQTARRRARSESKDCPIVKLEPDGSLGTALLSGRRRRLAPSGLLGTSGCQQPRRSENSARRSIRRTADGRSRSVLVPGGQAGAIADASLPRCTGGRRTWTQAGSSSG
jgi:hypothetical protein